MNSPVARLSDVSRPKILAHFLRLSKDDRRLRFGSSLQDSGIERYVERLDFTKDKLFGVFDEKLNLIAIGHLALCNNDMAEMGFSVDADCRGQGFYNALIKRILTYAKTIGVTKVFCQCLSENSAVRHVSKKLGMNSVIHQGEVEAHLEMDKGNIVDLFQENRNNVVALFDYAFKQAFAIPKSVINSLNGQ